MLSDNEESNSDNNLASSCPNIHMNIKEKLEENIKNIKLNEMTIKYIFNDSDKSIKIFSKEFVKNNKDKCIIIINDDEDDEQDLKCEINIDKNIRKKILLTIKLKEINP